MLRIVTLVVLLACCGCLLDSEEVCVGPNWSVEVQIKDATTGAWIGSGSTIILEDGEFADTVGSQLGAVDDSTPFGIGDERPGVYTVTVRRAGYREWRNAGVRVRDACDGYTVRTERLTALLQRAY